MALCVTLAAAQFNYGFDFNDGYLATSFGGPNYNQISSAAARDPRANTGKTFSLIL